MKQKLKYDLYDFLKKNYDLTTSTINNHSRWIEVESKLRDGLIEKIDLIMKHLDLEIKKIPEQTIIKKKGPLVNAKG